MEDATRSPSRRAFLRGSAVAWPDLLPRVEQRHKQQTL